MYDHEELSDFIENDKKFNDLKNKTYSLLEWEALPKVKQQNSIEGEDWEKIKILSKKLFKV